MAESLKSNGCAQVLHCLAKKHDGYWSARCLDFTLYAVGDSLEEAKAKLIDQIDEYLYDAIEGDDKDYAPALLLRKAPWQDWAVFYIIDFLQRCRSLSEWLGEAFSPNIPHGPYRHA
ncbi:type II toxin-antitoxin system HicB family antitoxin [Methylomonas sp. MS20]|uniref:type II toxin-antitoxin system HicB family antitoxin n=1 Tax=unclassified Methylomonas TaxID=2608980 RepID=UPI0028A2E2EA|nr:DUF1902 domain-containing protein [Methylomonas sp. MV1]MDT4330849.1 DUF1902 domain-containing protein [Methylomonas sp. MV1]